MADTNKITLPLTKPIDVAGETISALTFREPTGADLADCGMPVIFSFVGGEGDLTISPKEMTLMLGRLAATPPSTVRKLTAADWTAAAYAVAPFFLPAMPTPTNSDSSPTA